MIRDNNSLFWQDTMVTYLLGSNPPDDTNRCNGHI